MRILLPSHHWGDANAGAAGADANLASALRQRGHDAELIFMDDVVNPRLRKTRLPQVIFPWVVATRVARLSTRLSLDVLESTAGDLWVTQMLLSATKSQTPPIFAVRTHGLEHVHAEDHKVWARQAGVRLSLRYRAYQCGFRLMEVRRDLEKSAVVIVHNAADKQYAVERLRIDESKVHVIHPGISESFFQEPDEPSCQRDGVLFVGSWLSRKGIDLLPGILERVAERVPQCAFTLAGVLQPRERVLPAFSPAVAKRLTVLPTIRHEEVPGLMSRHSVLVFPSRCEGFGLVLVEAMARGMVVVTSPVGVAPEVIRHGANGLLVDTPCAESFAAAVVGGLRNDDQIGSLRGNARLTARTFSWERAVVAREHVYEEALRRRAGAARLWPRLRAKLWPSMKCLL